MAGLSAWVLLTVSTVMADGSYDKAYAKSQADDRPLLVLVGADWCPGCRTMKQRVMPRLQKTGKLGQVEFAQVDADREAALAGKLMRGSTIPQLILYHRTEKGWQRTQLTGAQAEAEVAAFVARGTAAHVTEKMVTTADGERRTGG